jgi:hypothetical protein
MKAPSNGGHPVDKPKNERRIEMKMTESTQLTQSTPDRTGLPREVEASLQAGRISPDEAGVIGKIFNNLGKKSGYAALEHLEIHNYIRSYYESTTQGFKVRAFTFNYSTSVAESEKMAAALREALQVLEFYLRMERESR